MPAFLARVGNSCNIPVDQVVFPPLDRYAGCLPSLIISNNGSNHLSQNDADVVQMGC